MERAFSIGGKNFQLSKIDAVKQFHIVRRIGPILAKMLPAITSLQKSKTADDSKNEEMLVAFAGPVMEGLSTLSDSDADAVLFGLLQAVEVQQSAGNWAKVCSGSILMIQDIELPILLQLAGRALMFNLSGFFAALPQK